jgi:hypothetical protein
MLAGVRPSVKFINSSFVGSVDRQRPVRQSWEQTPGRGCDPAAPGTRRRSTKTPLTGADAAHAAVEAVVAAKFTPNAANVVEALLRRPSLIGPPSGLVHGSFSPQKLVRTSPGEAVALGTFSVSAQHVAAEQDEDSLSWRAEQEMEDEMEDEAEEEEAEESSVQVENLFDVAPAAAAAPKPFNSPKPKGGRVNSKIRFGANHGTPRVVRAPGGLVRGAVSGTWVAAVRYSVGSDAAGESTYTPEDVSLMHKCDAAEDAEAWDADAMAEWEAQQWEQWEAASYEQWQAENE